MGLQCGIVGLPNVGKSTLFSALTNIQNVAANYEFATIDPNIGIVDVPDQRLQILEGIVNPQRVVPATIEFVDIAGLVKGASKGGGRGNAFLTNIREVDATVHVIRCFDDPNIVRSSGPVNPASDKEVIEFELQLKDLDSVEKKLSKVERAAKAGDAKSKSELAALQRYKAHLEQGKNARTMDATEEEREAVADLFLLTLKPMLYIANVDENNLHEDNDYVKALREAVKPEGAEVLRICAALEAQIAEITDQEEKEMFLSEYGLKESGLDQMIRAGYALLDLITYFTAGVKEVRAWTIRKGWKAPQAAGVIHSDFERGFIRAEVIKIADYEKYKSEAACREAGKISVEGKEYVVADGDIMHFRFNV
ncbi:redox-regulated ATPase YchF [Cytophagaceae bacterium YF14B1]|uniref:Ribosome-binding ATPase YchF n=1 Tax=Xanthocytophaga flava TaxID=3048013 RepID=A0AAE3U800_9BACT|nr:redox-regulated ATPase YchF [Xanthocytophaga flavus]MDJ1483479.1 redox-regulated ATPase YchF [Xanthocytophaga flavus]